MKIIEETAPMIKAEARLLKEDKTLWIKVKEDAKVFDNIGRVIVEDGSIFCKVFYQD